MAKAQYDPNLAMVQKPKKRLGPDGLPIMEVDAAKLPPIDPQFRDGWAAIGIGTPTPPAQNPARPYMMDAIGVIQGKPAPVRPISDIQAGGQPAGNYGVAATPFPVAQKPALPPTANPSDSPFGYVGLVRDISNTARTAGGIALNAAKDAAAPAVGAINRRMMGVHPSPPAPIRPGMGEVRVSDRSVADPYPPTPEDYRPIRSDASVSPPARLGMGDVRMADQRMQVDLPPTAQQQQNPNGGLAPLPFNDRKARQRAQADYQRILHTDSQGLDPADREARIQMIRDREDIRDAYSRQNAPLQKQQSVGEIQNSHSELARQLVGYKRTKVEDMDKAIQAAMNEPLSEDKQRKIDVLVAQRATAADDLQKTLSDPYWQQTSPDQAAKIQAGQQTLRERQMADRAGGAADVAAYQGRQQYDRNAADEMRQAEFARQRAAVGAETAGYGAQTAAAQSVMDNKGMTPADRLAQAQTEAEIAAITRANAANSTGTTPEQAAAAQNARVNSATRYGVNEETMNNIARDLGVVAGGMSGVDSGRVAGGTFGGAENINKSLDSLGYEIDRLEQMAQTDAPVAADWANKILNSPDFPTPMGDGTYSVNLPLTGLASPATILPTMFNSPARAEAAKKLTAVRQRLVRIAGGR